MGKILAYTPLMPEPDATSPYAQVEWVFREKMMQYENKYTQANYQAACTFYIDFLRQTNNYNSDLQNDPRFYLANEWDPTALLKLNKWLQATNTVGATNYLTSYTVMGHFSAVRQTMEYAYEHGYISKRVFDIKTNGAVPETDQRTAYSDEEYESIFKAVAPLVRFSKGLLNPYRRTGKGCDPRIIDRKGVLRGEKLSGQGWTCPQPAEEGEGLVPCDDNMRWYFENVMDCQPLAGTAENTKKHRRFFARAANNFGGLNNLYRKWNVSAFIDQEVIMPLMLELFAGTGFNVESVLSLRRDCFVKAHPLTGLPFLQYNKPRSGGEKELPLSLYDQHTGTGAMKLGQKQSQIIAKTIDTILRLTEPLISKAKEKDRDFLFVYQSTGNNNFGEIQRVNQKTIHNWMKKIARENDLRGRNGKPLIFNLSRFRPTKFTDMVKQGHDIFHIMAVAGHASVATTLSYIDQLKTTDDFHQVTSKALITIKNNQRQQKRRQLPIAVQPGAAPGKFIFKGMYCDCKNPYDPPEQIKKSRSYREGDACSNWNMCLPCENILITENNLPKLFAYRSEINRALANGVDDMPRQGELYKKAASILDEILAPDVLFSQEKLDWAAQLTANEEYESLDAFVY